MSTPEGQTTDSTQTIDETTTTHLHREGASSLGGEPYITEVLQKKSMMSRWYVRAGLIVLEVGAVVGVSVFAYKLGQRSVRNRDMDNASDSMAEATKAIDDARASAAAAIAPPARVRPA